MSAALLFASTVAGMAADPSHPLIAVPSGVEVWLQEELSDRVPGMGLIQRYRFVMPSLDEMVPPLDEADLIDNLPADMLDEGDAGPDTPLTPAEQAEVDQALAELMIEAAPADDLDTGAIVIDPSMPGDGVIDAPLPSELAAPDSAGPSAVDSERDGDLAAIAGADAGIVLPAAPDILMQDPVHRDIVWLCENYVLPRIARLSPRPSQVVISMASAESPFGSFDPQIVQLFEGFSIPASADACIWEPM